MRMASAVRFFYFSEDNKVMKTTKSIFAILLTVIMVATIFIGCKNNEESKPVNAIDTPVEAVDEIIDNLTEDISVEDTTTDENGNNVVIGTDDNGNTVEVKTDKDGNITKTITDKDTGKKTEETTKATTKAVTTTKKNTTTTTKKATVTTTKPTTTKPTTKAPTTTKKVTTTAKPTTTAHVHNYNIPIYAEKQVLVKAAWDEDIYETKKTKVQHTVCNTCGLDFTAGYKAAGYTGGTAYAGAHARKTGHYGTRIEYETVTTKVKTGTKHHPAEYKTEKYVAGYKCTCGAKK